MNIKISYSDTISAFKGSAKKFLRFIFPNFSRILHCFACKKSGIISLYVTVHASCYKSPTVQWFRRRTKLRRFLLCSLLSYITLKDLLQVSGSWNPFTFGLGGNIGLSMNCNNLTRTLHYFCNSWVEKQKVRDYNKELWKQTNFACKLEITEVKFYGWLR